MGTPKPFYRLCAWCPDSRAKTRELESAGWTVTHGICDTCYDTLMPSTVFESAGREEFREGAV